MPAIIEHMKYIPRPADLSAVHYMLHALLHIAAAWSKFTLTVQFNRSLVSSDRFFGTETSLTEESCSGSLTGISIEVLRLAPVRNVEQGGE